MSAGSNEGLSRRGFLAISAATLGGVMLAPGIRLIEIAAARAPDQPASSKVRWGLLIDTNKCEPGCDDCVRRLRDRERDQEYGASAHRLAVDTQD